MRERTRTVIAGLARRQTGRNRLPHWAVLVHLAVFIPSLTGIFLCWEFGFELLYGRLHPSVPFFHPRFPSGGIMAIPGLPVSILAGLIASNVVGWLIRPVRRAQESAFRGVKGSSFRETTGGLVKVAAVVVPICVAIALAGAWEPWGR
jgi:hypothetical protein